MNTNKVIFMESVIVRDAHLITRESLQKSGRDMG